MGPCRTSPRPAAPRLRRCAPRPSGGCVGRGVGLGLLALHLGMDGGLVELRFLLGWERVVRGRLLVLVAGRGGDRSRNAGGEGAAGAGWNGAVLVLPGSRAATKWRGEARRVDISETLTLRAPSSAHQCCIKPVPFPFAKHVPSRGARTRSRCVFCFLFRTFWE
jgi:hypothetical protein